jgi:hypothetical protein
MMLWWLMMAGIGCEYSGDESLAIDIQECEVLYCDDDASVTTAIEADEVYDCRRAVSYLITKGADDILNAYEKSYGKLTTAQLFTIRAKDAARSLRRIAYALNNAPELEALRTVFAETHSDDANATMSGSRQV